MNWRPGARSFESLGLIETGLTVLLIGLRPGAWLFEVQVLNMRRSDWVLKQVECVCFMLKRVLPHSSKSLADKLL